METIQWWWVSSPCLCNLSLRHTEISSLITDYYHKGDVVWSCLCCIDGCYACCLIYCDESRRHKDREPHAFFFYHMFFSSYVILRKNISHSNVRAYDWVQPMSFLLRKKTNSSIRSHENAKCRFRFYSIPAIKRFSSEFHSVVLNFFFGFPRLYSRNWTD